MNLDKSNLDTQLKLMNDILSGHRSIFYDIQQRGLQVLECVRTAKQSDDGETFTISKESYNMLFNIGCMISNESKFEQLGVLSKNCMPEIEIKKKILSMLQGN